MRKIVIAVTVAAPFFANAWGLGDALNKVNDATRKVQAVTQGVQDSAQGTQAAVQGAKTAPQAAASAETGQAAALAVARGTLSHPDAKEVFIDADDWTIDYKLGSPVRRRFGFWVLKDVEGGRKVFRMQACQDYQGGGQYGKLKYYAVGGGNYWVE